MRRALASLLLALFSFPLLAALSSAYGGSELPACCRRGGSHHCVMSGGVMSGPETAGTALQAIRSRCPYYPAAAIFPAVQKAVVFADSTTVLAAIVRYPAAAPTTETHYREAFCRALQKRGPPA